MKRKTFIVTALAALVALVAGSFVGRVLREPGRVSPVAEMTVFEPATPLPDFRLHDQSNQVFDVGRLRGMWSVLFFGYTHCPDVCPTTLMVLRDVQRIAGGQARHIQYVFVSVDPERDNPATLKRYVSYFHPEFVGVTGSDPELQRLTKALGVYYERGPKHGGDYEVQHSAAIFVIDPEAHLRALFAGPHEAARLAQGLQQLRGD